MEIADAFDGDVSPETFFLERLPELHRDRLELFRRYSDTSLLCSIHLTDTGERYSLEFSPDGARAIDGEMIDFPVLTLEGKRSNWELIRDHAERLFEKSRDRLTDRDPPNRVTREFLDDLERYDGNIVVNLTFEERAEPAQMRIILNDYKPVPDAPEIEVDVSIDLLDAILDQRIDPAEAREEVALERDVSFAFELSGLILEHFPELE